MIYCSSMTSPFQRLLSEENELMYEEPLTMCDLRELIENKYERSYVNYRCHLYDEVNIHDKIPRPHYYDYSVCIYNGNFLYEEWIELKT